MITIELTKQEHAYLMWLIGRPTGVALGDPEKYIATMASIYEKLLFAKKGENK